MAEPKTDTETNPILRMANLGEATLKELRAVGTQNAKDADSLRVQVAVVEQAGKATVDSIVKVGEANAVIAAHKQVVNAKAQNDSIDSYEAGGGSKRIVELNKINNKVGTKILNLQDELSNILSTSYSGVGMLDSVINQFRSAPTMMKLDAAKRRAGYLTARIGALSANTEAVVAANLSVRKLINEGTIAAGATIIAGQAEQDKQAAIIAAAGNNATAMLAATTAGGKEAEVMVAQLNVTSSVGVQRRAEENFVLTIATSKLALATASDESEKKALELAVLQQSTKEALSPAAIDLRKAKETDAQRKLDNAEAHLKKSKFAYDVGISILGLAAEDEATYRYKISTGNPNRKADAAFIAKITALGSNLVSGEGGTTIEFMFGLALDMSDRGMRPPEYFQPIMDAWEELQVQEAAKPKNQRMNMSAAPLAVAALVKAKAAADAALIKQDDENNYYKAPSWAELSNSNAVVNSPAYKKVWGAMGMQEFNPTKMHISAIQAVVDGELTMKEANESITAVYNAILLMNGAKNRYAELGIPAQKTFNSFLDEKSATNYLGFSLGATTAAALFFGNKKFGLGLSSTPSFNEGKYPGVKKDAKGKFLPQTPDEKKAKARTLGTKVKSNKATLIATAAVVATGIAVGVLDKLLAGDVDTPPNMADPVHVIAMSTKLFVALNSVLAKKTIPAEEAAKEARRDAVNKKNLERMLNGEE